MLDHLFHDCRYKNAFVFKGGTSLSKSYHVIERFSEDIDLILDWRKIINDEVNPWEERSKTKQDLFNKQINSEAAKFYKEELIPRLNIEMKEKLGDGEWISVDTEDEMVVNFYYPQIFEAEYLRSCVRLEIGPLAEWMPSHETIVTPFAAEKYPDIFSQKDTSVLTIDVERTFWEKLTILHKIANFSEGKPLPASEQVCISLEQLEQVIEKCKNLYGCGFIKSYRELTTAEFVSEVTDYMEEMELIEILDKKVYLNPAVGRIVGEYPADFKSGGNDE